MSPTKLHNLPILRFCLSLVETCFQGCWKCTFRVAPTCTIKCNFSDKSNIFWHLLTSNCWREILRHTWYMYMWVYGRADKAITSTCICYLIPGFSTCIIPALEFLELLYYNKMQSCVLYIEPRDLQCWLYSSFRYKAINHQYKSWVNVTLYCSASTLIIKSMDVYKLAKVLKIV